MATANFKGTLLEYCAANGLETPSFKLVHMRGPSHAPLFMVQCTVPPNHSTKSSEQPTKIAAEQSAAKLMLDLFAKANRLPTVVQPPARGVAARVDPVDELTSAFVTLPSVDKTTGGDTTMLMSMHILNLCPLDELATYIAVPKQHAAACYSLLIDKQYLRPIAPFSQTLVATVRDANAGQDAIGMLGGGAKKGDGPKTAEEKAAAKKARNKRRAANKKAKKAAPAPAPQAPKGGQAKGRKRRPRGALAQLQVPNTLKSFVVLPGNLTPMEKILQSLATPELQKPERYPQALNSKKTALATPFAVIDTPWITGSGATPTDNDGVGPSTMYAFAFRNCMRSLVYVDKNSSSETSQYNALVNNEGTSLSPFFTVPGSYVLATSPGTWFDVVIPYFDQDANHPYGPHGTKWFAGGDGTTQRTYFWLDNASHVLLNANGLIPTVQEVSLRAIRWIDGLIEEDLAFESGTADGTGALATPIDWNPADDVGTGTMGYFAFQVATTAAQGNFTLFIQNGDVHMAHRCLPDFERNFSSMLKTRVTAVSLRYANTAAAAYRQGEFTMYQSPKNIQWYHYINSTNTMSKKSDSITDTVINGTYMFLKPTELDDFEFQDDYELTDAFAMSMSHWPLETNSDYLVLRMDIDPNVTGTPTGQKGFFRVDYGIEFITDNIYFDIAHPEVSQAEFDKALRRLQDIPQFHENPTHLQNLFSYFLQGARGVINGITRYAPAAARIAQSAVPLIEGLSSLAL